MNIIEMERKTGDFGFQAKDENGHILHTDSSIENGGSNYGFRPMQLITCLVWEVAVPLTWFPF